MKLLSISIFLLCLSSSLAKDEINLQFKNGVEYKYKYYVEMSTNENIIDRPSEVNYTADFIIQFFGNDGILKINNVVVADNTQNVELDAAKNHFTDYYLRFNITTDGKIQWLLPDKREQHWVLNFKRGILSLFHTHLSIDLFNVDLHGVCYTTYTVNKLDKEWDIRREKDLTKCTKDDKKERFARSLLMDEELLNFVRYDEDGKQICNHKLVDKVYTDITCEEKFTTKGITKKATNVIVQNVKLISTDTKEIDLDKYLSTVSFQANKSYTDLTYYMPDVMRPLNDQKLLAESKLQIDQICKKPNGFVNHEIVLNLFEAIKPLNFQELNELENYSNVCENSRNIFIDILPYLPNQLYSRNIMLQILADKTISKIKQEEWLTILSFSKNIDDETLKYAYKLVSKSRNPNTILTVGNIVKNYCSQFTTRADCYSEIERIVNVYKQSIAMHSKESPDKADELLYLYLAGFHNTEERHVTISQNLVDILSDESLPAFVRKEVVEVLINKLSIPEKEKLLMFLNKKDESVELRISIFQKLIKLLPNQIVEVAKDILTTEKTSQVAHFIWSYLCGGDFMNENANKLENLNTTFFKELCTTSKYDDKLSHAYNANYIDSSVVFSPESFVPRNVRVDMLQQQSSIDLTMYNIDKYVLSNIFPYRKSSNNTDKAKTKRSTERKRFDGPYISLDLDVFGKKLKHYSIKGNNFPEELKKLGINPDYFMGILYGHNAIIQKSAIIGNTENFRVTAAGFPIKRDWVFDLSVKAQIAANMNDFFREGSLHFNSTIDLSFTGGFFTSNTIDTYYTKSSKKSSFGLQGEYPFTVQIDYPEYDNLQIVVRLIADKWQHKIRSEHTVGSETHKTAPPKADITCGPNPFGRPLSLLSDNICHPYNTWSDVKKIVEQYGYCDFNLKQDMSEINKNIELSIKFIKAEDKKYNVTIKYDVIPEHLSFTKHLNLELSKTEKSIGLKWLSKGEESFSLKSDYENNDSHKYIRLEIKGNKKRQRIPEIVANYQRNANYLSVFMPAVLTFQNEYML